MRRFLTALFISITSISMSWAVELKDVATVMKQSHPDLPKAEAMTRQFIAQKPDTTKGRYFLAMILERENRPVEALAALHEAQHIDPALKFASSSARYYEEESRLSAMAARASAPQAAPSSGSVVAAPPPAQHQVVAPAPTPKQSSTRYTLLWIVLGLVTIGGILAFVVSARAAAKRKEDAEIALRNEQKAELLDVSERLDAVILAARADAKPRLRTAAEGTRATVGRLLEALKRTDAPAPTYNMSSISQLIVRYESIAKSAFDWDSIEPAGRASAATAAVREAIPAATVVEERQERPAQSFVYQAPPQTTIIQHSSDDGLVTGMMLGSMLHQPRVIEREVIVEREYPVERVYVDRERSRARDDDSSASTSFDSGGQDRDEPAFDTGGGDSSDSSFDDGGNDS